MSESLRFDVAAVKARICGVAALLEERTAVRKSMGAILLAIVVDLVVNRSWKATKVSQVSQKSMSSNNLESYSVLLGDQGYIILVSKRSSTL